MKIMRVITIAAIIISQENRLAEEPKLFFTSKKIRQNTVRKNA